MAGASNALTSEIGKFSWVWHLTVEILRQFCLMYLMISHSEFWYYLQGLLARPDGRCQCWQETHFSLKLCDLTRIKTASCIPHNYMSHVKGMTHHSNHLKRGNVQVSGQSKIIVLYMKRPDRQFCEICKSLRRFIHHDSHCQPFIQPASIARCSRVLEERSKQVSALFKTNKTFGWSTWDPRIFEYKQFKYCIYYF